ncbi:hypothetical protein [Curtanaerobium respiraculi]|uniref:hypothetical protein n=1 Tax=Curtanaerobium respiraculi TaxID=2949669 RepID=UPI003D179D16
MAGLRNAIVYGYMQVDDASPSISRSTISSLRFATLPHSPRPELHRNRLLFRRGIRRARLAPLV